MQLTVRLFLALALLPFSPTSSGIPAVLNTPLCPDFLWNVAGSWVRGVKTL